MIIVVVGPTAVGKTKMSIELAKRYNAIVVNGDAMQVYKELNIGTAKVTEEEKEGVPHLLFDIADVNDIYTVYDYQRDLRKVLDEYSHRNIIIVGGSGLYIKAGLYDYRFEEEDSCNTYDDKSNEELYDMIIEKYGSTDIHVNNRKRLIRKLNKINDDHNGDKLLYDNCFFIGLTTSRENLYDRINKRVDIMVKEGLLEEVKSLYDRGIKTKAIYTGIGYKELYNYFDGTMSLEESLDLIKQSTRKYAKRQYTWFNHQMDINWFDVDFSDFNKTIEEVDRYIKDHS